MILSKEELIQNRRVYVYERLKDVDKMLFRRKVIDLHKELYLSIATIYHDYRTIKSQLKHKKESVS